MEGSVELSSSDAAAGAAVVSESLEGLVRSVDELKRSMGLADQGVDFAAVEDFVQRLRQENEEFRQFAEEAIMSAQRLRAERDELQARLDHAALEATMGAAIQETQKLKDVADEFERDLYQQKLAEAEARAAEVEALRERIAELEEENAGLTQTLNEFRQTTQQLQKLQSHEVRRLQAVEAAAGAAGSRTPLPPGSVSDASAVDGLSARAAHGSTSAAGQAGSVASSGGSPKVASSVGAATLSRSPGGLPAAAGPTAEAAEAIRIAEQLEDVAGGAESGLLASAAVALRDASRRDAELTAVQRENARLRAEVEELNDTMFSKTFKPPSAWAEREIKYKTEKRLWEEQQKELAARVAALTREVEGYNGASVAQQLEGRVQELEAALVQSEREKDGARAQLHELQLSMRTTGEFGNAGKRLSPYKGPLGVDMSEGHEVQQLVGNLESGSVGTASPDVPGAAAQRMHGLEAQLQAAASENQALRRQLAGQRMVAVPASMQAELGQMAAAAAIAEAAAGIEASLQQAETECTVLRQQLDLPAGGGASAEQQVQQFAQQAEAAEAAGHAEDAERLRGQAARLEDLAARLRQAEDERQALAQALQDLQPVRLQISAAAAAADGPEAAASAAGQLLDVPLSAQAEVGGATAPAAEVEAKAAEMEARVGVAEQEASELRRQLRVAVALEQAAADAAAAEAEAGAQLDAAAAALQHQQEAEDAEPGVLDAAEEEVEVLRQQLATAQQQKEAAQAQLWQLQELQEQLQAAAAERRRLTAELAAAGAVAAEGDEPTEVAEVHEQLAQAQQHSADLLSQLEALHPSAASDSEASLVGSSSEAQARLAAIEAEAARLRQQLSDLQPVLAAANTGARRSLDATIGVDSPDAPFLAAEASETGSDTALVAERRAADAALIEYQKSTDVPALLRAKVELETRCQMLEAQIAKMQGDLAQADEANAVFEDTLDSALKTGDVSVLSGLKDRVSAGRQSLSKRFKRQGKGAPQPSKDALKLTMHEMQEQLASSEEERNALKRQLAKLSKKYQQVTQNAAHAAGVVAGAHAALGRTSTDSSPDPSLLNGGLDEDGQLEVMKMREENQMLMEHVVMVKVRQAEMEGEYLEAKRQLLRTRETNVQLTRKLQALRDAAEKGEPLPITPKHGAGGDGAGGAQAAAAPAATPLAEGRKSFMRIPGL